MCRETNREPLPARHAADGGRRHVVLADVHAVGARHERDVGAVVDDDPRAARVREAADRVGPGQHLRVGLVPRAQLNQLRAAAEEQTREIDGVMAALPRQRGVEDGVERRKVQADACRSAAASAPTGFSFM
jgi:hypothetical protein